MKKIFPTRLATMLYALAMGSFGVLHLMNAELMGVMVPDFMPGDGKIWIYITGGAFIAAGLAILFNKLTRPACYSLAAMFLCFVFLIHLKPAMDGNTANLFNLLKDASLAMAAIIIGNNTKH
jgi:putative oxidoreductase